MSGLPTAFQDMNKNCETGLTFFFFFILRRLEDDRTKAVVLVSYLQTPDPELVREGFETPASGSVDRCLYTWPRLFKRGIALFTAG